MTFIERSFSGLLEQDIHTTPEMTKEESSQSTSIEAVRGQLTTYGSQIQEFLKGINANVEDYKFSMESTEGGGLAIDIKFRATIQGQPRHS